MESITVKVAGMTCSGCVASVTRVLQGVNGVGKVDVSLQQGEAIVEFDPGLAQREQLRAAIESAGFDATL
jgi:copper chaperone